MVTSVTRSAPAAPVRERILAAARQRFYLEGIRAVSADRIIADAAVSKVTFYRHFPTKDHLVAAYLRAMADAEREAVVEQRGRHVDDPAEVLRWYAEKVRAQSCGSGFRGCPFINAAAEYPDTSSEIRRVIDEHRSWLRSQAVELLGALGVRAADRGADQLMMLRDGAMVAGYLGNRPEDVGGALVAAGMAVIGSCARGRDQ
jgi:AcrR family transcriptional regulator